MNKFKTHILRFMILIALITGVNTSCKNALDEEVFSFVSTINYWKTEADADAGIIGVYESFLANEYYGSNNGFFNITEMASDFVNINRNETFLALDRWDLISNHPHVASAWNIIYQQIGRANNVISFVPNIPMNDTKKASVVAEAKFLRAFDYFNLVRLWGEVPMQLNVVESKETTSLPKSSVSEIYAQIEKDLKEAEAALPATRTGKEVGRVTSGAAKTLLAWVYLTEQKWAEAAAKAKEVMGQYQLLPDFANVFKAENENNAEIIFSIQYDGKSRFNALASFSHAGGTQNPNCFNGVRVWSVDNKSDIWTKWDTQEYRRNFSVYQFFTGKNGTTVDVLPDYPAFGKWNAPIETGLQQCYLNPIVLRYPDVLLIFAEAESQAKNGPTAEAYEAINKVRRRAYKLPVDQPSVTVDLKGLTKDAFRDAIIAERGFEFVMENKRIFDLFRTGTFKAKLKAIGKPATAGDLFPIPQSELDANSVLNNEDQNPGY
jgi:starch-binding outer membrane protein, SusD/RagB family